MGTHMGQLKPEHRARQLAKNARNRSRKHPIGSTHHLDMPVAGSARKMRSRLLTKGNRQARGVN